MATAEVHFCVLFVMFSLLSVTCLPEPGKKDLKFDKDNEYGYFPKTMNKGYTVAVKGTCNGTKGKIQIKWRLVVAECAEWYDYLKEHGQDGIKNVWDSDNYLNHSLSGEEEVPCKASFHLKDVTDTVEEIIIYPQPSHDEEKSDEGDNKKKEKQSEKVAKNQEGKSQSVKSKEGKGSSPHEEPDDHSPKKEKPEVAKDSKLNKDRQEVKQRKRRSGENENNADGEGKQVESAQVPKKVASADVKEDSKKITAVDIKSDKGKTEKKKGKQVAKQKVDNQICATKRDGVFALLVDVSPVPVDGKEAKEIDFQLTLSVEMKGKHGYLSASDWPLYPFYGLMSLLYVFYGVVWLVVSACQWRDLLRIQFWIGGVIALGMLEKAVFFSEYNEMNMTGVPNQSLTIFAELVSCVKRTLARILVIIVSMGFGIVKPRLGSTLHRVLGVGALYFILAIVEGCFRSLHPKSDPGRQQLIASIPLAVLDASICWWIFMSLVQTTRTLRIRRNVVKLSLYRHFTNTLIFAVLASVAYMIWSIKTHRFAKDGCITDWSELWLDEAFWHFLFSIVLLVIMVLWRPTANNQRYAFTPIVDFGDEEDEDDNMTLSDAFDGMKMRNVKNVPEVHINGDSKRKHKPEDDLKWVEENIPSSAADVVLPSVLDSDEELMTTKFEMSKME
ncbi:transmembrane protein 87A-like [Montipora capricornis]|uniref:transmembrane protein 87A-like n=1 Tax=Montipora capricornis TaxID=246305 RepID=UPI0035F11E41